ncbi:MAG: arsenosugar biosynthesis radical SAM (seleno)protein ArsS [Synechococcaceae cyanobacterium]|nr:arsenosugar biosynthesis radical SAM (seleno)protein ArsS [Synechococcaceae cyanobacterium]
MTLTFPPLRRSALTTLQVNLGYRCNQACSHCHVEAGPQRTEQMEPATVDLIPAVLRARGLEQLDITGGAPELHPRFRALVREARSLGVAITDRCNLTILQEPGQEDLAAFLASQQVTVVASLPCYSEEMVDRQRGAGVFRRSIQGLRQLNRLGYGQPGSPLTLHLVFNPHGPSLPPPQDELEAEYRRRLLDEHGVVFHRLLALANLPVGRWASQLQRRGELEGYLALLRQAHRAENLEAVMCRSLISVDWQGRLHDCDFNQQLQLGLLPGSLAGGRLEDLLQHDPEGAPIAVAEHCFGCSAGSGSSCGGALR